MSEKLNQEIEGMDTLISKLWKQYAELFNSYNPHLEESHRNKMNALLSEIRSLESKRESKVTVARF